MVDQTLAAVAKFLHRRLGAGKDLQQAVGEPPHGPGRRRAFAGVAAQQLLVAERAPALARGEHALADATGGAAGSLRLGSARAAWPLSLARAEQVSGAGWVLLGDAAHVVHPLAGQGLNLGLADVRALAQVIAQRESWRELGDARLLQRYARQRALPTLAMGQLTDGLLHLFASEAPLLRELRNRGLSLVNGLPPLKRLLTTLALDA